VAVSLDALRRFAVARSLFQPVSLKRAFDKLPFVQADPIRAPARAQDLTLRHRVFDYHAGDLERRYAGLAIEEDVFINYGFVSAPLHALMHPRADSKAWPPSRRQRAELVLDFVRARGEVHPREVDEHFSHGRVTNYWGGSSNATTFLLDAMHYRGLVRVTRRERGVRLYAARDARPPLSPGGDPARQVDALVDILVTIYAPIPGGSLSPMVSRLRYAVPHWHGELKDAVTRARQRLACVRVDGVDWYWPPGERPERFSPAEAVRLLAPFDPVAWDRSRFERLWGWSYRFEAYTPVAKRKMGYYALPLLWRDRIVGWGNVTVRDGALQVDCGYVGTRPRDRAFARELDAEIERMREFLRPREAAPVASRSHL
jgi:uncharacterized protein